MIRLLEATLVEWIAIIVVISFAGWLIFRIRARFRDHEDPAATDHVMLRQMGDLHREGGLTDEEFRSIKGRLTERLKEISREGQPGSSTKES